ncbi:MAG: hypothetical protein JNL82_15270 [Myxococcales bacterium]|nr:hypothetical protein [Myxococcales bacterium]
MSQPATSPPPPSGRPGFVADLGFLFVVPWLLLWRYEVTDASSRSLWVGWTPALVVPFLCIIAIVVALNQRQPRGFLPYPARWAGLAMALVLPAWIALAVIDAGGRVPDLRDSARETRAAAEAALAAAPSSDERRAHEGALVAAESAEKLATAIESTEARGAPVPSAPLGAPDDAIAPESRAVLEQAVGLAHALEHGSGLPPEFAAEAKAAGLDDEKLLLALLVLAAGILAPLLGLSTEATLLILQTLVTAGELSPGNLMKVTYALATSARPDGTFDEPKLLDSLDRATDLARDAKTLFDAAEKAGAVGAKDSPLYKFFREAADDAAAPPRDRTCFDDLVRTNPDLSNKALVDLAKRSCLDLTPKQIQSLVRRRGGPR